LCLADYFVPSTGFDHRWGTSGGFGGGFVGYNYQISNFVIGLQGEYNYGSIKGSEVNVIGNLQSANSRSFGSIDGRVGIALDRALLYGIGGVAFGNPSQTFFLGLGPVSTTFSGGNNTGWDAGVGVEYAFTPNWTARVEYRHYDFGSTTVAPDLVVLGLPHTQRETIDTGRVGIAYKFGGPVVAKY
jgi:outer membrane immunogenic protein